MRLLFTLLVLITLPLAAQAALLGTATFARNASITPSAPHETRVEMIVGPSGINTEPTLFNDVLLTASSQGLILTATMLTDTDFDDIAAELTDGAEEQYVWLAATLGVGGFGQGGSEKFWFSLGTNDFAGYNIDTITLTVDEIGFETTNNTTSIHLSYTVRVYGEASLAVHAVTWGAVKALYR